MNTTILNQNISILYLFEWVPVYYACICIETAIETPTYSIDNIVSWVFQVV